MSSPKPPRQPPSPAVLFGLVVLTQRAARARRRLARRPGARRAVLCDRAEFDLYVALGRYAPHLVGPAAAGRYDEVEAGLRAMGAGW